MEAVNPPPAKKVCYNKEYLSAETAKQVVRPFKLTQQFPSKKLPDSGDGVHKLLKLKSPDGKDLGEFKVKMISKDGMQFCKTIMLTKQVVKVNENVDQNVQANAAETPQIYNQNSKSDSEKSETDAETLLKLQTQYTTKARCLPEKELKITPGEKVLLKHTGCHRPLILKKNAKPILTKATVEPNLPQKVQAKKIICLQKALKPVISEPSANNVSERVIPDQGKVIKSYTRTLKKIGPNFQLLPHDSPDAKTIVNAVSDPVISRNGSVFIVQKPLQKHTVNVNGVAARLEQTQNTAKTKDLSRDLTIIEQALSSLSNNDLREKALKALAECGIGIERQVPIKTPIDTKSVHDSDSQTNVFGLLEDGDFVTISDTVEAIKRQKVKERSQNNDKLTTDNVDRINKCMYMEELDKILSKTFGNKENIIDVDKILNRNRKPKIPEKVVRQLFKDFQSMKEYDEDGLLGIHQVVVDDKVKEVERYLLMMKMFNMDVDVKTQDGNTSLELAVVCDVNIEIIKMLLKARANPTTKDLIHNSAVILASKRSSPCLPLLLQYLPSEALNTTDKHGFTCLHYCSQKGNAEGVTALLSAGADVNFVDKKSGRTALFIALENRQEDVTRELLKFGANSSIPNYSSQTVLPLIEGFKSYSLRAEIHKAFR